jgi:hypothetical protein
MSLIHNQFERLSLDTLPAGRLVVNPGWEAACTWVGVEAEASSLAVFVTVEHISIHSQVFRVEINLHPGGAAEAWLGLARAHIVVESSAGQVLASANGG